ncbi:MAG: hypothetical protein SCALA702_32870 [Melioribacteraceae bacterium]|nr:MAG: hypothetical protein SCALA702_32870 [Melioribacteraceae bacterium]
MITKESKLKSAFEYEKQGKFLHALQVYKSLLGDEDFCRTATLKLSVIYSRLNNLDSALKLLTQYTSSHDTDYEVIKFLAHFFIQDGQYSLAIDTLTNIPVKEHPDINYMIGLANYKLKNYEAASSLLLEYIYKNQNSVLLQEAYLLLAKIEYRRNSNDKALRYAKSAKDYNDNNSEVHLCLAKIYHAKEMSFHAYEEVRRAGELNSSNNEIIKWTGKILIQMEDYKKAERKLKEYLDFTGPNAETFYLLGVVSLKVKKIKEAKCYFDKALNLDPGNILYKEKLKDFNSV